MGTSGCMLVLALVLSVGHCSQLTAPDRCRYLNDTDYGMLAEDSPEANLYRFCQAQAAGVRREHFYCRGFYDDDMELVNNTATAPFPSDENYFWSILLQFPALSYMDVARKGQLFSVIGELLSSQTLCNMVNYEDFCVDKVETYDVSEYKESVYITLYNFGGLTGEGVRNCFRDALRSGSNLVTGFRGKTALRITLNVSLAEMFSNNIGPASSIGNEARDPTLRPIYINSWPDNRNLRRALRDVSDSDFASNPDPINYGLEPGDIVFAFFGSVLLVVLASLIVLGFFIHPFFLS